MNNNQIHCIQYKNIVPEESGCKKFFKLHHQKAVLEGNRILPQWLNFTLINDLIYLEGVPTENDVGQIALYV